MITATDLCADEGISLNRYTQGRHYRTCPRCSPLRKKANRKKPCLRVEIDDRGVRFACFHCSWFKARFYDEDCHGKAHAVRGARSVAGGRASDTLRDRS